MLESSLKDLDPDLHVLAVGGGDLWWRSPGLRIDAVDALRMGAPCDAVVIDAPSASQLDELDQMLNLPAVAADRAVVILTPHVADERVLSLLRLGVEEVVQTRDATRACFAIRCAVERKRLDVARRLAYATDLETGLPHQAQLQEYLSQLIALRAREPAPLVLIALRIEGLQRTASRLGQEAASILRRKLAVRLRATLRASDVVASTGPDTFGILLGHVDALSDVEKVVAKLQHALQQPILVAGQSCDVAVASGLASWPEHGRDSTELIQRAMAQALAAVAMGPEGYGHLTERGFSLAANDDDSGLNGHT